MFSLVVCLAVAVSAIASPTADWVQTPHGLRPRKCVHTVEEAHHSLKQVVGGVEAHYPNSGRTVFHAEDSECVENMRLLKKQREEAKVKIEAGGDELGQAWTGWLVYVMHDDYHADFGYYASLYSVPNESPAYSGQLLYFFTGFENPGDSYEYSIIQPVVSYGYNRNGQWNMASWNCCPSGQSWSTNPVWIPAGAKVDTYLSADPRTGATVINMAHNGRNATLRLYNDNRKWVQACSALETYYTSKCDQFTHDAFVLGQQSIKDKSGKWVSPNWRTTNQLSQCSANIWYSQSAVDIMGRG